MMALAVYALLDQLKDAAITYRSCLRASMPLVPEIHSEVGSVRL